MTSLLFLGRKLLINRVKMLLKKPVFIVMGVALVALMLISMLNSSDSIGHFFDLSGYYYSSVMAITLVILLFAVKQGLSEGASFFNVADTHYLFTAPIKPADVLIYGVLKQMGVMLVIVLFMFLQVNTFRMYFNWSDAQIYALYIGAVFLLLASQFVSLCVYSYTAGDKVRGNIVLAVTCAVVLAAIMPYVMAAMEIMNGAAMDTALQTAQSAAYMRYIPVLGSIAGLAEGISTGNVPGIALCGGLTAAALVLAFVYVRNTGDGFYEDVLGVTARMGDMKKAKAEGKVSGLERKNVKVGKTGLTAGAGASAFFFKQMLERRRSGWLFDGTTILTVLVTVFVSVFTNSVNEGGDVLNPMLFAFGMLVYMSLIMQISGAWGTEMRKHFLMLVPEQPFVKMLCASVGGCLKMTMDGVIALTIVAVMTERVNADLPALALSLLPVGLLFTSAALVCDRIVSEGASRVVNTMLYMLFCVLFILPGVVVFIVGVLLWGVFAGAVAFAVINLLIAAVALRISSEFLHYAEFKG